MNERSPTSLSDSTETVRNSVSYSNPVSFDPSKTTLSEMKKLDVQKELEGRTRNYTPSNSLQGNSSTHFPTEPIILDKKNSRVHQGIEGQIGAQLPNGMQQRNDQLNYDPSAITISDLKKLEVSKLPLPEGELPIVNIIQNHKSDTLDNENVKIKKSKKPKKSQKLEKAIATRLKYDPNGIVPNYCFIPNQIQEQGIKKEITDEINELEKNLEENKVSYTDHNLQNKYVKEVEALVDLPFIFENKNLKEKLGNRMDLKVLNSDPFILQLFMSSLPHIEKYCLKNPGPVNRYVILKCFVESCLAQKKEHDDAEIIDETHRFLVNIAWEMHSKDKIALEKSDKIVSKYLLTFKFADNNLNTLNGSLLHITEEQISFIHESSLDYFTAESILENLKSKEISRFSQLNPAHLTKSKEVMALLRDAIDTDPKLKITLLNYIQESRVISGPKHSHAASSNAITLLNGIGYDFSNMNLSGIRIPGAILTNGRFDNVNFQEADLSHVIFNYASLQQANFDGAAMENVQFGELPIISAIGQGVFGKPRIGFSEDGLFFGTYFNEWFDLFQINSSGKLVRIWSFNEKSGTFFVFTKDKKLIFGGQHNGCKVYDIQTLRRVYQSQKIHILRMALSPDGSYLATIGSENAIRMWECENFPQTDILEGHTKTITSCDFSPDSKWLISGSDDKTIRIWKREGDRWSTSRLILENTSNLGCTFSPNGKQFLYRHSREIRICDFATFELKFKADCPPLCGAGEESGYTLSPTGNYLIAWGQTLQRSSEVSEIRVWELSTTKCQIFRNPAAQGIMMCEFTPDDQFLFFIEKEGKIKAWNFREVAVSGVQLLKLNGAILGNPKQLSYHNAVLFSQREVPISLPEEVLQNFDLRRPLRRIEYKINLDFGNVAGTGMLKNSHIDDP